MRVRTCKQCDIELSPDSKQRSFCSPKCYYGWNKAKTDAKHATCPVCANAKVEPPCKTCSKSCGYAHRKLKTRPQRECKHCEELFWPTLQNRGALSKYCSRKCYYARVNERHAMTDAICEQCKTPFVRTKAALERVEFAFCSRRCVSTFYTGSKAPMFRGDKDPNRGAAWNKIAAAARDRDQHKCRRCGCDEAIKDRLSVDHIIPWRLFDDKSAANNIDNLASLCRSCHAWKTSRAERKWLQGDGIEYSQYLISLDVTWRELQLTKAA